MENCTICSGHLSETKEETTYIVSRHTFYYQMPVLVCDNCGDSFSSAKDLAAAELYVANELSWLDNIDGKMLKFMRKAIGLSRKSLALIVWAHSSDMLIDMEDDEIPVSPKVQEAIKKCVRKN